MAISIGQTGVGQMGSSAATMLFERLPDRLFGPLAAEKRHYYWTLLCHLHRNRFGPDAPFPPSDGFAARDITRDIEDLLLTMDEERAEMDARSTPLNIRANGDLQMLVEAGWLKIERKGFDRRLTMSPGVSHFLSLLVGFAETGPVFVAGKIRAVELNLHDLISGGEPSLLHDTAEITRNLLAHVRNTGVSVREVMDALGVEVTTREYVKLFFGNYIETVFIGDYKQLRTRDHPLARRAKILAQVDEIYGNEAHRTRLIAWYRSARANGNEAQATRMFERDVAKLQELSMIDEYLDRLDEEIRRANRRAYVFLDYRLRSARALDGVIAEAIARVQRASDEELRTPFAPGVLTGPNVLAEPRRTSVRREADPLRKRIPSASDIARSKIMARARQARSVTVIDMAEYVRRHLEDGESVDSQSLTVDSIKDVRVLQSLGAVALSMSSGSRQLNQAASSIARGFRAEFAGEGEAPGDYISGKPFQISRKARRS